MTTDFERPAARRGPGRFLPAQGWFALVLVTLMCLALAWSLDDAILVLGDGDVTDFLTWAALGGVLIGALGPTVGWGRWTTHLIGAAFAALLVPLLVGQQLPDVGSTPHDLFGATTTSAAAAWSDLIINRRPTTFEYGHHLLVLGLIVWGSSQFASYAAFGHRRPLNAVIVIGLLLLANMALTTRPQLPYLVMFSVAALFLLVRFHTFDEQSDWLRRRIGDPSAISGLYLRGGYRVHRRRRDGFAPAHERRGIGSVGRGVERRRRQPDRVVAGHRTLPPRVRVRPLAGAFVRADRPDHRRVDDERRPGPDDGHRRGRGECALSRVGHLPALRTDRVDPARPGYGRPTGRR